MNGGIDFSQNELPFNVTDMILTCVRFLDLYQSYVILILALLIVPIMYSPAMNLVRRTSSKEWAIIGFERGLEKSSKDDAHEWLSGIMKFSVDSKGRGEKSRKKLEKKIRKARASSSAGTKLEGEVAEWIGIDRVVRFQEKIYSAAGMIGEIDVETKKYLVEVTMGKSSKSANEFKKYFVGPMNPEGKKVILFAPDLADFKVREIEQSGVIVIRDKDELQRITSEE